MFEIRDSPKMGSAILSQIVKENSDLDTHLRSVSK